MVWADRPRVRRRVKATLGICRDDVQNEGWLSGARGGKVQWGSLPASSAEHDVARSSVHIAFARCNILTFHPLQYNNSFTLDLHKHFLLQRLLFPASCKQWQCDRHLLCCALLCAPLCRTLSKQPQPTAFQRPQNGSFTRREHHMPIALHSLCRECAHYLRSAMNPPPLRPSSPPHRPPLQTPDLSANRYPPTS